MGAEASAGVLQLCRGEEAVARAAADGQVDERQRHEVKLRQEPLAGKLRGFGQSTGAEHGGVLAGDEQFLLLLARIAVKQPREVLKSLLVWNLQEKTPQAGNR